MIHIACRVRNPCAGESCGRRAALDESFSWSLDRDVLSDDLRIESYLDRVRRTVSVERGIDLCRRCGKSADVYSILRTD